MTDVHKAALLAGRKKKSADRKAEPEKKKAEGKPVLVISGKEENAVAFRQPIRFLFRSMHDYITSPIIINKIMRPNIWTDIPAIHAILEEYVILSVNKNKLKLKG